MGVHTVLLYIFHYLQATELALSNGVAMFCGTWGG